MQDNEQSAEAAALAIKYKLKPFCQVCRHFSHEGTGHEPWCPVYTQESVKGLKELQEKGAFAQISAKLEDGWEVAQIYKEGRERLLEELRTQVEINRKLSRELIDVRLELARLKMKYAQGN